MGPSGKSQGDNFIFFKDSKQNMLILAGTVESDEMKLPSSLREESEEHDSRRSEIMDKENFQVNNGQ